MLMRMASLALRHRVECDVTTLESRLVSTLRCFIVRLRALQIKIDLVYAERIHPSQCRPKRLQELR